MKIQLITHFFLIRQEIKSFFSTKTRKDATSENNFDN